MPGLGLQPLLVLDPDQLVRDDHQGGTAARDGGVGQHQALAHTHLGSGEWSSLIGQIWSRYWALIGQIWSRYWVLIGQIWSR